jgi:hypothetical protein
MTNPVIGARYSPRYLCTFTCDPCDCFDRLNTFTHLTVQAISLAGIYSTLRSGVLETRQGLDRNLTCDGTCVVSVIDCALNNRGCYVMLPASRCRCSARAHPGVHQRGSA